MTRCVYTALTGGYETLNEQPMAAQSAIPFICFTDDPNVTSESWQVRPFRPVFPGDDIRSQRDVKLRPHHYLPDFAASLYIDNSVRLTVPPERIFDAYDLGAGLALPAHSFRATVRDEFLEVALQRLDDPARIAEQLRHYEAACPEVLEMPPFWAGILLRDHDDAVVIEAMHVWLVHICRYARRDQLSSRAAFAAAGLRPEVLHIDNFGSWFHSWPHLASRRADRRLWQGEDAALAARALALQWQLSEAETGNASLRARVDELERGRAAMLGSLSWRMTAPLRKLAGAIGAGK